MYAENSGLTDCSVTFADASLDDFRAALSKYQKQKEDIRSMGRTKEHRARPLGSSYLHIGHRHLPLGLPRDAAHAAVGEPGPATF